MYDPHDAAFEGWFPGASYGDEHSIAATLKIIKPRDDQDADETYTPLDFSDYTPRPLSKAKQAHLFTLHTQDIDTMKVYDQAWCTETEGAHAKMDDANKVQ